jgi:uncharacterized protein (DUF433 family)
MVRPPEDVQHTEFLPEVNESVKISPLAADVKVLDRIEDIKRMVAEGKGPGEIAAWLGMEYTAMMNILSRYGYRKIIKKRSIRAEDFPIPANLAPTSKFLLRNLKKVYEMASNGATDKAIAEYFKMDPGRLYKLKDTFPALAKTLEQARTLEIEERMAQDAAEEMTEEELKEAQLGAKRAMIQKAIGYEKNTVESVVVDEVDGEGKPKRVVKPKKVKTEYVDPDVSAAEFVINGFKKTPDTVVNVNQYANMSDEELLKYVYGDNIPLDLMASANLSLPFTDGEEEQPVDGNPEEGVPLVD